MVRFNIIESRVPPVMATPKEVFAIFMMALAATSIIALTVFCLVYIFTHVMGWM